MTQRSTPCEPSAGVEAEFGAEPCRPPAGCAPLFHLLNLALLASQLRLLLERSLDSVASVADI